MKLGRKILLWLIGAGFLAGCAGEMKSENASTATTNPPSAQNKKERIKALQNSVFCVSLVAGGKNFLGKYAVGTAFLVGDGLLASAYHVQTKADNLKKNFEKAAKMEMVAWKTFDAAEYVHIPVELFVSDRENDLAIYRFDEKLLRENPKFAGVKPLALAENLPPLGEEVVAAGYYGDYQFPFNSVGNVSMIDKNEDIFSDITIMPGNSGAPLVSLETGEVLGVTVSVLELGNETVRFAIAKRASKLKGLLRKLEK